MATATYRIGPSDFFTPGDLSADADTLDGQANELNDQVEAGNVSASPTLVDQWTAWLQSWRSFKSSTFGGFFTNLLSALNDSNRDQLIQYETTFGNFAQQFAQSGATLGGGIIAPSTGSQDTLGAQLGQQVAGASGVATKTIIIVALVVVALFIWKK